MKKSERARLAALLAKDQAAHTAAEKAELATLQALAVQHPDATKDTEEAPAATAPTLGSMIKGAFASLGDKTKLGADLAQARTQLATCTTERDAARTQLAAASAQVSAFAAFFGLSLEELSGKDAAALTQLLGQKVSALAGEQVAQLGFPAGQLPPAPKAGDDKTKSLAEWRALGVHERAQFFRNGGKLTD